MHIIDARGHADKISHLMPYIESVCWASKPLNLTCIAEFQYQMMDFFGRDISESIQKSTKLDPDLKACFKDLLPTPIEINDYFVFLSERTGISLQVINAVGTEYAKRGAEGQVNNFQGPGPNDFPGFGNNQGPPFGGGGGYPVQPVSYPPAQPENQFPSFGQGGYPPQGGYPQSQGGYPPQGGFGQPSQGYPPSQGGYPPQNQGGFPQQPYYGQEMGGYGGQQPPQFGALNNNNKFQGPPQNEPSQGGLGQQPSKAPQGPQGGQPSLGGYPEFGNVQMPGKGAVGGKPEGGNAMPSVDDFEDRMRKLRDNLN